MLSTEWLEQQKNLQLFIQGLSHGMASKLCIFGAGGNGITLHNQLMARLIKEDFVCDNNPDNFGYFMDNVLCISLEMLKELKSETLVIVSPGEPAPILEQLAQLSFPYVVTKDIVEEALLKIPDLRYFQQFREVEGIDYASPPIQALLDSFSSALYNLLKLQQKSTEQKQNIDLKKI